MLGTRGVCLASRGDGVLPVLSVGRVYLPSLESSVNVSHIVLSRNKELRSGCFVSVVFLRSLGKMVVVCREWGGGGGGGTWGVL